MSATFTMPEIPDKLSDSEARNLLEKHSKEVRELGNEIMRNNARAEQGEQNHKVLMERANEGFGTLDPATGKKVVPDGEEGVRRILDERMVTNAQRVRAFFADFADVKARMAAINKTSPTR